MLKRFILAVIAVFVVFWLCDFVVHGLILPSTYHATASLWRTEKDMKIGLLTLATVISVLIFVGIYQALISPKSPRAGATFGLLYGLAAGVGMGVGTYATMPIPVFLAVVWFFGSFVEYFLAGIVLGLIIKK